MFRNQKRKFAFNAPRVTAPPLAKAEEPSIQDRTPQKTYSVLWRKKTAKKNKTWDGDGIAVIQGDSIVLKMDSEGTGKYKVQCRGSMSKKNADGIISIGSYELELDSPLDALAPVLEPSLNGNLNNFASSLPVLKKKRKTAPSKSPEPGAPAHDPELESGFVLPSPSGAISPVVVDERLSSKLRPHQRDGVVFLYRCIMGFNPIGNGSLLADEMGLGKTFMTISIIFTLLKQSPFSAKTPLAKKILIVCPVTLITNWRKEIDKWVGKNQVSVLAINGSQTSVREKSDVLSFGKTRVYQVLILGYEKVLTLREELSHAKYDLLVCDEAHRLKNANNKAAKILSSLEIERKILLTGTPIQNDLLEFYNLVEFANPGVLGTLAQFQKEFVRPILQARDVNCVNSSIKDLGEEKSQELISITKKFMLRRTNTAISHLLPPRTDFVVFVPPTDLQISLFKLIMNSTSYSDIVSEGNVTDSLSLITVFRKLCNSPALLKQDRLFNTNCGGEQLKLDLGKRLMSSGKIKFLLQLLAILSEKQQEKVVIISNFTQTLDIIQSVLGKLNFTFSRLDGSTPAKQRDSIVTNFNTSPPSEGFVFLLSAKSGGVGLNLIGASRLVLFDNDWNPSVDLQAMARIHRQGQQKPVFIYRLLTKGCIDEKIFQRQMMKSNLSEKFLDENEVSDMFDYSDLRDLFTLNIDSDTCNTHDLIECDCVSGMSRTEEPPSIDTGSDFMSALDCKQLSQSKSVIKKNLEEYEHCTPSQMGEECTDFALREIAGKKIVSFVFVRK